MSGKRYGRRGHYRRTTGGKSTYIQPHSYWGPEEKVKAPRRPQRCKGCGALIIRRTMRDGGLVSFEAGDGLQAVKHPCHHLGEHLSQTADKYTLDLFENRLG